MNDRDPIQFSIKPPEKEELDTQALRPSFFQRDEFHDLFTCLAAPSSTTKSTSAKSTSLQNHESKFQSPPSHPEKTALVLYLTPQGWAVSYDSLAAPGQVMPYSVDFFEMLKDIDQGVIPSFLQDIISIACKNRFVNGGIFIEIRDYRPESLVPFPPSSRAPPSSSSSSEVLNDDKNIKVKSEADYHDYENDTDAVKRHEVSSPIKRKDTVLWPYIQHKFIKQDLKYQLDDLQKLAKGLYHMSDLSQEKLVNLESKLLSSNLPSLDLDPSTKVFERNHIEDYARKGHMIHDLQRIRKPHRKVTVQTKKKNTPAWKQRMMKMQTFARDHCQTQHVKSSEFANLSQKQQEPPEFPTIDLEPSDSKVDVNDDIILFCPPQPAKDPRQLHSLYLRRHCRPPKRGIRYRLIHFGETTSQYVEPAAFQFDEHKYPTINAAKSSTGFVYERDVVELRRSMTSSFYEVCIRAADEPEFDHKLSYQFEKKEDAELFVDEIARLGRQKEERPLERDQKADSSSLTSIPVTSKVSQNVHKQRMQRHNIRSSFEPRAKSPEPLYETPSFFSVFSKGVTPKKQFNSTSVSNISVNTLPRGSRQSSSSTSTKSRRSSMPTTTYASHSSVPSSRRNSSQHQPMDVDDEPPPLIHYTEVRSHLARMQQYQQPSSDRR